MSVYAEVYQGKLRKGFRWRVKNSENGKNMANGSEAYTRKGECYQSMTTVLGLSYDAQARTWTRKGEPFTIKDLT